MTQQHYSHAHAHRMPDPKDRTPNDPAVLVEHKHLRAWLQAKNVEIKNTQVNADPSQKRDAIVNAYVAEAKKAGWTDVKIIGGMVLLTADVRLVLCDNA